MEYLHFSLSEISFKKREYSQFSLLKPEGLWFSLKKNSSSEWKELYYQNSPGFFLEVRVHPQTRIRTISTLEEYLSFEKEFSKKIGIPFLEEMKINFDWNKFSKSFDALVVIPFEESIPLLEAVEIHSLVILNLDIVESWKVTSA